MRELDWNLLRSFVVLAQSSSVTEAAGRLRLTQPSVSTALKRLESHVGRKLIDRAPGHFVSPMRARRSTARRSTFRARSCAFPR